MSDTTCSIRRRFFPTGFPKNPVGGHDRTQKKIKIEVRSSDQTSRLYQLKKTYRMSQNTGDFIWPIISFTVVVIISARVLDHFKQSNNSIIMEEQIDDEITNINRDQNGLFTIFKYLQDTFEHKFPTGTAGHYGRVDETINPAAFYELIDKVRIADASDHVNNDTEAPVFAGVDIGSGSGVIALALAFIFNYQMYGIESNSLRFYTSLKFREHIIESEQAIYKLVNNTQLYDNINNDLNTALAKIQTPIRFVYMICLGCQPSGTWSIS